MAELQDSMLTFWHFKIWEPEIDPEEDFNDDIRHSLKKLSKLVELDSYEVNVEKGRAVAKVRLQRSKIAIQQSNTLEDGIKHLCEAGIEPVSRVFRTYWTASFFNAILAQGPELIDEAPFHGTGQDKRYLAPTALVFAVAALGGIFDVFRMFQQLYNKPSTSAEEVQRTIKESMPTESEASENKTEAETQDRQELEARRMRYRKDLKRFTDTFDIFLENYKHIPAPLTNDGGADLRYGVWTYTICSNLCDMMTVASELLRNNKPLLGILVDARKKELTLALHTGILTALSASMAGLNAASVAAAAAAATTGTELVAAAASATALSVVAPPLAPLIFIGGTSVFSALMAVDSFNKSQQLNAECDRLRDVFEATVSSWTRALNVNIIVQKFQHGMTKSSLSSTDKDSRDRWEQAITEFDRMSLEHINDGCSESELVVRYVNYQAIALQKQRQRLIV